MDKPQQGRLSIGKASEYLGVAIETLRRWDSKGKIRSYRSPGGHRYFLKEDLDSLFSQQKIKSRRLPYKKPKKRIAKNLPIRRMFLFLLIFFAAVDVVLIFFYFFARNLASPIPYF